MASSPSRRPFDYGSNHVVLDFVNTVSGRPTYTRDDLTHADDIFAWADGAGLLNRAGHVEHGEEQALVHSAIALRENLYRVFDPGSLHAESNASARRLDALVFVTRRAAQAMRSASWVRDDVRYEPRWSQDSIESICDRLADEALLLLRSPALARVGACAGCGWLFLDTSRAHARRWCSMNVCGVRDKMRRYHQRQARATSTT